jgi:hypothetical protein
MLDAIKEAYEHEKKMDEFDVYYGRSPMFATALKATGVALSLLLIAAWFGM